MKKVIGNLLDMFDDGTFDVIVHGCNCHGDMGGGIAAQIATRYPKVEAEDKKTIVGNVNKLGNIIPVYVSSELSRWFPMFFTRRFIINAYTQYFPGRDGQIMAVRLAFKQLADEASIYGWDNQRIGIPAIGCGIAGLDWEDVERVIDEVAGDLDITLVEYQPIKC